MCYYFINKRRKGVSLLGESLCMCEDPPKKSCAAHTRVRARAYYTIYIIVIGERVCAARSFLADLLFAVSSRVVIGGGDIRGYIIIHYV